jgi:hypothetical protein
MTRTLLSCLLIAAAGAAQAQFANIDGRFKSASTTVHLIALDPERGVIAAATSVVQGACSGSIAGIGKMSGDELKFSPYVKTDGKDACVVSLTFAKGRNAATIKTEGCAAYSGAACGWEGDTLKRSK